MLACLNQECFQLEGLLKAWGAVHKRYCGRDAEQAANCHRPLCSAQISNREQALLPQMCPNRWRGKRMHSPLWHYLNAHQLWTERKTFLTILVEADVQSWYAVILFLLCREINTDAGACRDVQGSAGFQQRNVLVEVKVPLLPQVFSRKWRSRYSDLLESRALEATACFFEPTKPKVGDKTFWGINNLVIIGQHLLWVRYRLSKKNSVEACFEGQFWALAARDTSGSLQDSPLSFGDTFAHPCRD